MEKNLFFKMLKLENSTAKTSKTKDNDLVKFIKGFLDENGIEYCSDEIGNIFNFKNNKPLFCCHTDSMKGTKEDLPESFDSFPLEISEVNGKIFGKKNGKRAVIGGDDTCGVFILLNLLLKYKDEISFAFFSLEEIGMIGSRLLLGNTELSDIVRTSPYAIVIDRKGNNNIVCSENNYGTVEFEERLVKISNEHKLGFGEAEGYCSDADVVRRYVSTANISCGYYNAHSKKEYVIFEDVIRTYNFCEKIIENIKEKFPPANGVSLYVSDGIDMLLLEVIKQSIKKYKGIVSKEEIVEHIKNCF